MLTPDPFYVGTQFAVSCGYFIADSIMLLLFRIPQWQPVLAHHVLAIIGTTALMGAHREGNFIGVLLFLTECTNPLNNLDWYAERFGVGWTRAGRVLRGAFVVAWFSFRIVPFFYIYALLWRYQAQLLAMTPVLQAVCAFNVLFLTALNFGWFVRGPFYMYFCVVFLGHPPPAKSKAD